MQTPESGWGTYVCNEFRIIGSTVTGSAGPSAMPMEKPCIPYHSAIIAVSVRYYEGYYMQL